MTLPEIPDTMNYYISGIQEKNRRILSKAITLIESSLPEDQEAAGELLEALLPHTGNAVRLGITGVPGVGKSTFVEAFGMYLLGQGLSLAVLGVARKTREAMLICEAAGYDVIIVETVGVGQSETTVASMVDFFLVLMLAGAGDELQGIKKGVLELADAVAINKADQDNIKKAERARKEYENALHLLRPASPAWSPPVMTCSAVEADGIAQIWSVVTSHRKKMIASGEMETRRKKQAIDWMWSLVDEGLKYRFHKDRRVQKELPEITEDVNNGKMTPTFAANRLLFFLDNKR
ncbi:MAG: methylmalonyl Co-A mutase-associated GTPase MeaB [Deltaproteobacteria bacterium]|nr:methylmalonyl Co-A mutase-associated GTPase MeaB [Deltaproteobacteria bacterium]